MIKYKLNIGNYTAILTKHKLFIIIVAFVYYLIITFFIEYAPTKENDFNLPYDCIHNSMPTELKCIAIVILMFAISSVLLVLSIKLIFKLCKL